MSSVPNDQIPNEDESFLEDLCLKGFQIVVKNKEKEAKTATDEANIRAAYLKAKESFGQLVTEETAKEIRDWVRWKLETKQRDEAALKQREDKAQADATISDVQVNGEDRSTPQTVPTPTAADGSMAEAPLPDGGDAATSAKADSQPTEGSVKDEIGQKRARDEEQQVDEAPNVFKGMATELSVLPQSWKDKDQAWSSILGHLGNMNPKGKYGMEIRADAMNLKNRIKMLEITPPEKQLVTDECSQDGKEKAFDLTHSIICYLGRVKYPFLSFVEVNLVVKKAMKNIKAEDGTISCDSAEYISAIKEVYRQLGIIDELTYSNKRNKPQQQFVQHQNQHQHQHHHQQQQQQQQQQQLQQQQIAFQQHQHQIHLQRQQQYQQQLLQHQQQAKLMPDMRQMPPQMPPVPPGSKVARRDQRYESDSDGEHSPRGPRRDRDRDRDRARVEEYRGARDEYRGREEQQYRDPREEQYHREQFERYELPREEYYDDRRRPAEYRGAPMPPPEAYAVEYPPYPQQPPGFVDDLPPSYTDSYRRVPPKAGPVQPQAPPGYQQPPPQYESPTSAGYKAYPRL